MQLMHQKGSEQFVRFVETLVASEHYSELGRRLLLERVKPSEGEHKINEKYGDELHVYSCAWRLYTCTCVHVVLHTM